MRTNRLLLLIVVGAVLSVLSTACRNSHASWDENNVSADKNVTLRADEVHEGWYFAAGNTVTIDGTVNGDAYAAGGTVVVNGKIDGDLMIAGGRVEMNGTVTGSIRGAGGTVVVNGSVGRDVTAAGGTVDVGKSAVIAGNLLSAGGNVNVMGIVTKNAKIGAGNAHISGTIGGDCDYGGGKLDVTRAGAIAGNLHAYVSDDHRNVTLADSAVRGNTYIDIDMSKEHSSRGGGAGVGFRIYWFLALLFTGLLILLFLPAQFTAIGATIMQKPGASVVWSLVAFFGAPMLIVLLMITIVGIPVSLVLIIAYLWLLFIAQLALAIALGRRVMGMEAKRGFHLFLSFAVGLAIITALGFIPFVGPILIVGNLVFGVGAILMVMTDAWNKVRA